MRKAPQVFYDPIRDMIWEYDYYGWVEGYLLVTPKQLPMRAREMPEHFEWVCVL